MKLLARSQMPRKSASLLFISLLFTPLRAAQSSGQSSSPQTLQQVADKTIKNALANHETPDQALQDARNAVVIADFNAAQEGRTADENAVLAAAVANGIAVPPNATPEQAAVIQYGISIANHKTPEQAKQDAFSAAVYADQDLNRTRDIAAGQAAAAIYNATQSSSGTNIQFTPNAALSHSSAPVDFPPLPPGETSVRNESDGSLITIDPAGNTFHWYIDSHGALQVEVVVIVGAGPAPLAGATPSGGNSVPARGTDSQKSTSTTEGSARLTTVEIARAEKSAAVKSSHSSPPYLEFKFGGFKIGGVSPAPTLAATGAQSATQAGGTSPSPANEGQQGQSSTTAPAGIVQKIDENTLLVYGQKIHLTALYGSRVLPNGTVNVSGIEGDSLSAYWHSIIITKNPDGSVTVQDNTSDYKSSSTPENTYTTTTTINGPRTDTISPSGDHTIHIQGTNGSLTIYIPKTGQQFTVTEMTKQPNDSSTGESHTVVVPETSFTSLNTQIQATIDDYTSRNKTAATPDSTPNQSAQPPPNNAPENPSNSSLDTSAFDDEKALEEHLKNIDKTSDDAIRDSIIDQVEKSLAVPDTGNRPEGKPAAPAAPKPGEVHSSTIPPSTSPTITTSVAASSDCGAGQNCGGANGCGPGQVCTGPQQSCQPGQNCGGNNALPSGGSTSTTGNGNTTGGAGQNTATTAGENFGPRVQGGWYNVPIYVYNNGKSAQTVQVSVQNAPWLTLTGPTTVQVAPGGQPEAVNAQINTTNLPPGVYTGTITYTCTNCSDPNSPPTTYTGQVTVQVVPSTTSFGGPTNPNDSQFRGLVNGQPADLCTVLQGAISEVANSSFGATAAGQAIVSKLRKDYLSNNCEHLKPTATVSIPDKSGKPNEQTQVVDGESEKPGNAVYVLKIGPGPYFYAHLFADEDIYVGIDLTPTGVARARQNPGDYYIFTYQGKIGVVPRSELISTLIHEGLHAVQSGKYNVPRPNGTGNASSTEEEQDGFNAGDQAIQALGYPPEGVTVGKGYGRGSNPNYKPLTTTGATQQAGTTAPAPKTAPSTGGAAAQPGMNPPSNQPANSSNPGGPVNPAGTANTGTGNAAGNSAANSAGTNNAPAAAGGTTVSATNVPENSSGTTAADCNCNLNALLQAFHDAQDAQNAAETALQNAQTRANTDQAALDAATQALQNPPPGSNPAALQASYNIAQANDAASQAALRTAMTNYAKAQEAAKAAEEAYDNCVAAKKNCPPPTNAATGPSGNTGNNSGTNGNSSANNTSSSNAANAAAAAAENAASKANETKVSTPPMESGAAAGNPKPAPKGARPSGEPGNSNNGGDNNGADNGANNGNAGDNPPPPPPNPTPAAEKRPKNFRHAQPATDPTGITEPNQYTVTVCEGTNDYVFRAGGEEVDARNVNSTSHDATGVGFGSGVRISGNHVGSSTIGADFFRFDGTLAAHVKIHVTVIDCGHHATVAGDNNNGPVPNLNPPVVTGAGGNANANPPGGDDNPNPPVSEGNDENPPPGGDTGESSYFDPSDGFDELNNSLFGNASGAPTVQYIVLTMNVNFGGTAPQASLGQGMSLDGSRPVTAMNRLRASRTHARFQLAAYRLGSPSRAPSRQLYSDGEASSLLASLPSAKGLTFSIASNGNLGSNALVFRVHDPSGRLKGNVRLPEGMVLEPLKMGTRNPVSPAGGGSNVAQPLTAYCLEMAKLPPETGQLYRLAPQAVQQKYKPIRGVLRAGSKLTAAGKFHPDSDPAAYADFIRQHALWAQLENWTEQKFTEVFLERTRKNAEHLNVKWTNEMTDALRAAAPGRWRDVAMVLDEAHKLSGAAGAP